MKIERKNTCIAIYGYNPGDCQYIERLFSIYDKVRHCYNAYGIYYDEDTQTLYLPNGFDDFYIFKNFPDVPYSVKQGSDEFDRVTPSQLRVRPRDEVQLKAINYCLGLGQYYNNRNRSQISLNLNTGKGKTYVAITIFAYYSIKTMMIASSIDWLNQWKEKILEYTNLSPDEIYIISGAPSIYKLKSGFRDKDKIKFYLCSHDTLSSYAKKNGWESIHELFQYLRIGIKIYDEAHLYFNNILMIDFFTNTWKTYYLTATPIKSDRDENKIYQIAYSNIPKLSLFNEDTDPHTKYIAVQYNSHPTLREVNMCKNAYGFDRNKYIDYTLSRPNFFKITQLVVEYALKNISVDGKILIYIGTNKAIAVVYAFLTFLFGSKVKIGVFSSLVSKEKKKEELNNTIILTTTKSAGAALDIEGLQVTIVLDEPFNSAVLARQTLGRTRAKDTMYIDVVDIGFNALVRYYRNKQKIFRKYATSCDVVIYEDYMIDQCVKDINDRELKRLEELSKSKQLKEVVTFIKKKNE